MATLAWWFAWRDGSFFVNGLDAPASELLGPLLPAISAGFIAALSFSVVDAAAGGWAAAIAALVVVSLPGFLPLHGSSLDGPPLTAITLLMLAVMLYAPRFSLAYGVLAATGAVFVSSAGAGLPLAAIAWAWMPRRSDEHGPRSTRLIFALVPLLAALALAHVVGDAWPDNATLAWRGHLDEGLRAAGRVVGDQLAPTLTNPALRFFAIADITLILGALAIVAWRRIRRLEAFHAINARFHPALAVTAIGLCLGLALRWLLLPDSPAPDLAAVFPLVVLIALLAVGSAGQLWRGWPRWGKVVALVLFLGWLQAAVRA